MDSSGSAEKSEESDYETDEEALGRNISEKP